MSVETTTRKVTFDMDGSTTEFPFTFRALTSAPTDIKCKLYQVSTETASDLTYTTDYSVSVNSDGIGGTVTVVDAKSDDYKLTIYRETTDTQESDYEDYNRFPADTLEEDLDKRTMITQEIKEDISRAIKFGINSSNSDIDMPEPEAGKAIGWNDDADGLENMDLIDTALVSKASIAEAEAGTDDTNYMTPSKGVAQIQKSGLYTVPAANLPTIPIAKLPTIPTEKLTNGSESPGNSKYYGTDSSGTKGFFSLPDIAELGNIGDVDLSSAAQGDILYRNASGKWVNLPAGTSGKFLKTQGAGANPVWAIPLASGTFTGSGSGTKAVTGIGFQPTCVIVVNPSNNNQVGSYFTNSSAPSGKSYLIASGQLRDNGIVSLDADGFTVGTDINSGTSACYYICFKS